jgi:hypothetical protein
MVMLNKLNGVCYCNGVRISQKTYDDACAEARNKAALVSDVYAGRMSIEEVSEAWREEITRRVDERKRVEQEERELNAEEALGIILGGEDV